VALAGVVAAVWFFTANDDATTSGPAVQEPGVAWTRPPPHAADVRRGNVVLAVTDPAQAPQARALAREIAGPDDGRLRASGQAVIVDAPAAPSKVPADDPVLGTSAGDCRDAAGRTRTCPTVLAYAQGRAFSTTSAADPALRAFVEYWLGRSSG
jgi:hypothetical protein